MRPPIFVPTLSEEERKALESGLRSSDAFVLRRCQIHLANARGERAPRIAERQVSGQTIWTTLARLGVRWKRAKRWIESPDPEYAR